IARLEDQRRAPFRRFRYHLQLRQLPVQGQPAVEGRGRRRHVGRMAGWHRWQGQRRRRRLRQADQGFDRICRTGLRLAERHVVRAAAARRRQLGTAGCCQLPGRGGHRRLGPGQGLQPGDHQCARRRCLADRRRQLHADVPPAEESAAFDRDPRVLQVGPRERPAAGTGAGLRAAAARPGRTDRGLLGGRDPAVSERADAIADRGFRWLVTGAGILVLAGLAAAMLSMAHGGRDAFAKFGFGFLWSDSWDPVGQQFGALVPIYGTVVTALIAMLIAVPVSFGIAMFLTEIAPKWLRGTVGAAIELLAGIPSIIYGMWGLFVLVPVLAEHVY